MTGAPVDLAVWPAAVNAALLGTDRAPMVIPAAEGALGAACARLVRGEGDPSATLLRVAAAASAYRRGGWAPARTDEPLPTACPPDARPMCTPSAAGLLRRILQGEHESLLGAWLALADRHGVRAPTDVLRDLLDLGRREPALRRLIVAAGSARATWLASFNEEWSYAGAGTTPDALVATWETGTGAARLAALQQLRVIDAERARLMLEATWQQESGADRGGFVAALARGLSPADEPFLERALDDRRKEVRQQAAALLATLPTSALVARMVARAKGMVSLGKKSILRGRRFDVTPPAVTDAALLRDGVDPKPPTGVGIGDRAWWLSQIIAAVPPATWTSMWSLEPAAVILASDSFEWREPLLAGWLTATERFRDEAWARALWQNESHARIEPWWSAPTTAHVFTTVASAEHVDAELCRVVGAEHDVLRGSHPALAAILEWPHEWTDALARLVARRLKEYAGDPRPLVAEFGVPALMDRCAHAVPVSAVDAFLDGWPEHVDTWPAWARAVDSLISVLRFRRDLHVAFNE